MIDATELIFACTEKEELLKMEESVTGKERGFMKRSRIFLLAIIMAAVLSACGSSESATGKSNSSTYQKGLEVVALLDEMVQNDTYVQLYTASAEIQEIVETVATGDYSEPSVVYQISLPGESLSALAEAMGGNVSMDGMSPELTRAVEQKLIGAVISQVNAMGGAANLAAMSVCTAGKTFVNEELSEDVIYLYVYENAAPAAVTFLRGDDGIVSATGTFLLSEDLNTESEQSVSEFFGELGVEVSVVTE